MTHSQLVEIFRLNPVVSAVSDLEKLNTALNSPSDIIFMLTGDISNLEHIVKQCKAHSKTVFLHLDLIKGFSKDAYSLKYIKKQINPDGIISTKMTLLKAAREEGFFIIQRVFMLDSSSYESSVHSASKLHPDAVEVMPGVIPKVITYICKSIQSPIIAGGLLEEKNEVILALKAGATSISTTNSKLWYQ